MPGEPHFDDDAPRHDQHHLSESDLLRFLAGIAPGSPMHDLFANEARFGLSRLLPVLSSKKRDPAVLEVGAGSCMLSAYLASKGVRITAVEPLESGFAFLTDLQNQVLDVCRNNRFPLELVRATGEQLHLREQFDVAFTINALEHMRDPLLAIDNMYRSLRPGGTLLAHCPNYTIPYDSHFNVLLVTRSKRLNERIYRSKIDRRPQLWQEINFIRYADVRRHLMRRGLPFVFDRSVMRDLVTRSLTDRVFAARMPTMVLVISKLLQSSGLISRLTLVRPRWQTPMEVRITKPEQCAS
jgi:SAM-dependent methyltransferase